MTEQKFQSILLQVRDKFLKTMKQRGFWYLRKYRYDPLPWDINNGLCFEFVEEVCKLVPKAKEVDIVTFEGTDDVDYNNDLMLEFSHAWILWNGKHYDAECIDGVVNHRDLPFFKHNPRLNLPKAIRKLVKQYSKDHITPSHINNGYCADFATVIWEEFQHHCSVEILNNEDLTGEEYLHTFMKYGGLFYDAEAPNGVSDWRDLPFFKREKRSGTKNKKPACMIAA